MVRSGKCPGEAHYLNGPERYRGPAFGLFCLFDPER